jgi:flagella basal body P-ring formation protein FlgA
MIKESANGQLFICDDCKQIHLEFNGIRLDFPKFNLLMTFYDYLDSMDVNEIEKRNEFTQFRRKVTVIFPKTKIKILLSRVEFEELKQLLRSFISGYIKNKVKKKSLNAIKLSKDLPAIHLN